ncbi:hypothetical protein [Micromonospora sp. WMMC250]|uniref:hypothetical protein n=1 Tax=Micromonospora sp. WMMC250 TaxID=3014781 RepID=UPI0022B73598|nr:hypothetical protein [Micromonospora sp. WMMC250]MCZ7374439.1 hypothetical protein [Micromonospora sp. WMMC250]
MRHLRRGGALAAVLGLILFALPSTSAVASDGPSRYRNPVSAAVGDTFADHLEYPAGRVRLRAALRRPAGLRPQHRRHPGQHHLARPGAPRRPGHR